MANKESIEAGRGHVALSTDDSGLRSGLAAARQRFASWGANIATVGAAIAGAAATVAAPFLYGLGIITEWGANMRSTMRETGTSFTGLDTIMSGFRVTSEEITPALAKMASFLDEAAHGSASANQALGELGLSLSDLSNLDVAERALTIADAISRIGDASTRVARQRDIFGRGGLSLNIEGGRAGIQARAERVQEIQGPTLHSEEAQRTAAAYARAVGEMKLATRGFWASLGAAAAPAMTEFVGWVTRGIVYVRSWVDELRPLLDIGFRLARWAFLAGSAIASVGGAMVAATYALPYLTAGLGYLTSGLGLVWGLAKFAATGFGLMSVASMAWSVIVAGASAVASGAVWAFNGTLAIVRSGFGVLTLASWAWGVITAASSAIAGAAVWAFNGALAVVKSGFGVLTVASWAWGTMTAASSAIASGAVWAWSMATTGASAIASGAVWLFNAALGAVASGFGLISLGATVMGAIASAGATIGAAAMWAYGVAVSIVGGMQAVFNAIITAGSFVFGLFSGAAGGAGVAALVYKAGAWLASIATSVLTAGINLLIGAIVVAVGAIAALTLGLGGFVLLGAAVGGAVVALAYAVQRVTFSFGELHDSLAFLDVARVWIQGLARSITDFIERAVARVRELWQGAIEQFPLLRAAVATVRGLFGDLRGAIAPFVPIWNTIATVGANVFAQVGVAVARLGEALSRIGEIATGAGQRIGEAFMSAFRNMADAAPVAWSAISSAFQANDMEIVWETIKVSALLAWTDIAAFGIEVWYNLRNAVGDSFTTVWDTLVDTFRQAWTQVRLVIADFLDWWDAESASSFSGVASRLVSWFANAAIAISAGMIRAWGRVNTFITQSLVTILRSMTSWLGETVARRLGLSVPEPGEDSSEQQAQEIEQGIQGQGQQGPQPGRRRNLIMEEARQQAERDIAARAERDGILEQQRALEALLRQAGTDQERAALRQRLDGLEFAAEEARLQAEADRETEPPAAGEPALMGTGVKLTLPGTFAADAIAGLYGGGESPAARAARMAEQQLRLMQQQQQWIQNIQRILEAAQRIQQQQLDELRGMEGARFA